MYAVIATGGKQEKVAQGEQVQVDGVEDEFDAHEHHDGVLAGQHAVDADAEQHGAQQEELSGQHGLSPSAPTRWRR